MFLNAKKVCWHIKIILVILIIKMKIKSKYRLIKNSLKRNIFMRLSSPI